MRRSQRIHAVRILHRERERDKNLFFFFFAFSFFSPFCLGGLGGPVDALGGKEKGYGLDMYIQYIHG